MNLASLTGLVASASGVFMALSPLLQARRIRAVGDSSEVSAGVFLMMRVNATVWLTYGLATANLVVVVPNAVALATTTFTLLVIRRHRHLATAAPAPALRPDPGHMGRVRGGAATLARAGRRIAFARR